MTADERQVTLYASFDALRRLVSKARHPELENLLRVITAIINDHGASEFQVGYERGRTEVEGPAYERGKIDGMMAIECHADRRDLMGVPNRLEWQSVH